MKKLFILPFFLILVSCGSTPKADIAAIQVSLTTADNLLLKYSALPACDLVPPGVLCSKPSLVKKARTAALIAYDVVVAARTSESAEDIAKAENAVVALQNIIRTLRSN